MFHLKHFKEVLTTAKQFVSYENGIQGEYTLDEMKELYNSEVDKTEYQDFDTWIYDMIKSGVFEEITITI
jgi:hypothetical protein